MKKFISLVLVAILVFSFAACNNDSEDDSTTTTNEQSTLELNIEELKYNWTDGILTFANGKQITVPCTISQFVEASGLEIQNGDIIANLSLEPDESKDIYLVSDDTYIGIECENLTTENVNIMDATIVEYIFNNTKEGNRNIKFANTLTVGVGRADVEEALGVPKGATAEDVLYVYSGRNDKRDKVELRITFNSDNIVNSVAFKIDD